MTAEDKIEAIHQLLVKTIAVQEQLIQTVSDLQEKVDKHEKNENALAYTLRDTVHRLRDVAKQL